MDCVCPECGDNFADWQTEIGGPPAPEAPTCCPACGTALVFLPDLTLVKMTTTQYNKLKGVIKERFNRVAEAGAVYRLVYHDPDDQ